MTILSSVHHISDKKLLLIHSEPGLKVRLLPGFGTQCLDFIFLDELTASELLYLTVQITDVSHGDTHRESCFHTMLTHSLTHRGCRNHSLQTSGQILFRLKQPSHSRLINCGGRKVTRNITLATFTIVKRQEKHSGNRLKLLMFSYIHSVKLFSNLPSVFQTTTNVLEQHPSATLLNLSHGSCSRNAERWMFRWRPQGAAPPLALAVTSQLTTSPRDTTIKVGQNTDFPLNVVVIDAAPQTFEPHQTNTRP